MHPARRLWRLVEPCHAFVYFAPEARPAYEAAGLKGGWMGYFASRSAAMGAVAAPVVVATFHNFAPAMVARSIPDAWTLSTPERVLEARSAAASAAALRLWGDHADLPATAEAAELLRDALTGCVEAGRPLYAAHARLPWPDRPHLALWHAATLFREHRFDGHVAALVGHDVDGLEALILMSLSGGIDRPTTLAFRGWTDQEWDAAIERLRARGAVEGEGSLTGSGRALKEDIEDQTNAIAGGPVDRLGATGLDRLAELVGPLSDPVVAGLPFPNPLGLPR